MLNYLKDEAGMTFTENGAVTRVSTGSACLDLFATIGALREATEDEMCARFDRAYRENPELAVKTLFFARDIRGGLGERRVFRTLLAHLAKKHPEVVEKNLPLVAEYGRFDDLLSLSGTPCETAMLTLIRDLLAKDMESLILGEDVTLLAKWLPSANASSVETVRKARKIIAFLGISESAYRKNLSALRAKIDLLENRLRERDYTFDYAKQPSRAAYLYRAAFLRNDGVRYRAFLNNVEQGQARMNTATLTPYDVIAPLYRGWSVAMPKAEERKVMDVTWNALLDFTGAENALVVADGSGSMYSGSEPLPAAVAQSLAIYFAERNKGAFRNHFITFSEHPRLVEVKGSDIAEKVRNCARYNEVANTDLEAVFRLILDTAVAHNVPQEELPSRLYIISDMEFDYCAENASMTNFENAKAMFEAKGYHLPEVVFWNVNSRRTQQPVSRNEQGVALVSGNSPQIFRLLQEGELSPENFMLSVLRSERYAPICA